MNIPNGLLHFLLACESCLSNDSQAVQDSLRAFSCVGWQAGLLIQQDVEIGDVLVKVQKQSMCIAEDEEKLAVEVLRIISELNSEPANSQQKRALAPKEACVYMSMKSIHLTACPHHLTGMVLA